MKKLVLMLICLCLLFSVSLAEEISEGYMYVNPDRNLFSDKDFNNCIGHFTQRSLVYAINNAGVNGYEVRFMLDGTHFKRAYICVAEPSFLSEEENAIFKQQLIDDKVQIVDEIPLPTAYIDSWHDL